MRVLYLANQVPWFGDHTGYTPLAEQVEQAGTTTRLYASQRNLAYRAMGKAVSLLRGHGRVSQSDAAARLRFELGLRLHQDASGHILDGEEHLPFWQDAPSALRRRTVLTLHQPSSQWTDPRKAEALSACPQVIIMWRREIDWFRQRLKGGLVHFIPLGVDLDFFSPAAPSPRRESPIRLLYAGVHLRNTPMLGRIIDRLSKRHPELGFDLLVPLHRRSEPALRALQDHPAVTWHAGLSDLQLRELYRTSHLLLLPMNDSGVNTAIVESIASGLPPVTTDVGGIRDYGGGTVFPVVKNDDDEAMLTLIEDYLAKPAHRAEVSRQCRAFAETQLGWPLVARRHLDVYRKALE